MLPGETVKEHADISRVLVQTQTAAGRIEAATAHVVVHPRLIICAICAVEKTVGWVEQTAGLVAVTVVL